MPKKGNKGSNIIIKVGHQSLNIELDPPKLHILPKMCIFGQITAKNVAGEAPCGYKNIETRQKKSERFKYNH